MSGIVMVQCEFNYLEFGSDVNYTCEVKNQAFDCTKMYQIDVENCQNVNEVKAIRFIDCDMQTIPQNFPWHQFPNLQTLDIENSNLIMLRKDDFGGMRKENLKRIYFSDNSLEYLPGDLFEGMQNLEIVSFGNNKIKYIEAELIGSLMNLKELDFEENSNINMWCSDNRTGIASLEEMKRHILEYCQVSDEIRKRINMKDMMMIKRRDELIKENLKLKDQIDFSRVLINAFKKETTKDFALTVNDQSFKVHKILLIAHSPVLAEMIENNPEADSLRLEHIPLDIFQLVLDFMYKDTLPQDVATFKDIFIAAGRLKIEKLKNYTGDKLIDQVNEENAFELLNLANKFDHEDLRMKAFETIKEFFPDLQLDDVLAKDQQSIQYLIDFKLTYFNLKAQLNERVRNLKN